MEDQRTKDPTEYTVRQKAHEEGWKLHFELEKHITTLSTGSILILATFLEKLFTNPSWKFLVALAFGCFVTSIVADVMAMNGIASIVRDLGRVGHYDEKTGSMLINVTSTIGFTGFLLGIICLVVFAVKNLYV